MSAHGPPRQRERLLKLLFAAVDGRGEEVACETIAMGTRLESYDEERFMREVGQTVARYAAHSRSGSQSEGRLMLELVALSTASGLRRSEEHTSELQSLMRNSYAVFCLKKKKITK